MACRYSALGRAATGSVTGEDTSSRSIAARRVISRDAAPICSSQAEFATGGPANGTATSPVSAQEN